MKKKFRILLTLVMSLTMIFGMSTTAYAGYTTSGYYYPDEVNACNEGDPTYCLHYVSAIDASAAFTIYYYRDGSLMDASETSHWKGKWSFPDSNPIIGRVYYSTASGSYLLDDEHNHDLYLPPSPSPEPNVEVPAVPSTLPESEETPSVPSCNHDFRWQTITSATATTYGTEGEVCSKCGATKNVRTMSPLDDWFKMQISNTKPGDVLKLNFGPWNSYPLWMMQMIADNPTVTYIFNYTYQGNKYEVTIKPGDTVPLDFDWYGPAKMAELFDTVIVK